MSTNENYRCCDEYSECECSPVGMESEINWGNPEQQMKIDELEKVIEKKNKIIEDYRKLINSPVVDNFLQGVGIEAAHQQEKWGVDHDAGKTPFHWVFLVSHLITRAASKLQEGDVEKALHHTITTAAVCLNWHRHIRGEVTRFRPGSDPAKTSQSIEKPREEQ